MMLKEVIDQYVSSRGQDILPPNGIRKEMIDRFIKCLTNDEIEYMIDVFGQEEGGI